MYNVVEKLQSQNGGSSKKSDIWVRFVGCSNNVGLNQLVL